MGGPRLAGTFCSCSRDAYYLLCTIARNLPRVDGSLVRRRHPRRHAVSHRCIARRNAWPRTLEGSLLPSPSRLNVLITALLTPLVLVFAFQGVFRIFDPVALRAHRSGLGMGGEVLRLPMDGNTCWCLQHNPGISDGWRPECCEPVAGTLLRSAARTEIAVPSASEWCCCLPLDDRNILAGKAGRGIRCRSSSPRSSP